jgi:very-short-patch-repair endonuclease
MQPDESLRNLAASQHGLITSLQAQQAGLSRHSLQRRLARGEWRRVSSRVIRATASADTDDQRLMATALDAGSSAFLSHSTAARLWDIPGFDADDIQVSRLRASTGRPARRSRVHEPRLLPSHHLTRLRNLPLTNPTRTIFDLAGVVSPGKLERALDTAWSRRLVTGRSLHGMLPELAQRGRSGIGLMRQLLEERPRDYTPMDSGTEVRAKQVLADAGIRDFEHQVDLGDEHEWLGRVDLVDRARRIVIEIDSERYLGALIDRRADAERTARLEAAGYIVRRVIDTDVWHRPRVLVRTVRDARRERRSATRSGT